MRHSRRLATVFVAHRLGYLNDATASELERDVNGVGAPLAGLVRTTRVNLGLSALCFALVVGPVWLAV
jgi:hypothetical protein